MKVEEAIARRYSPRKFGEGRISKEELTEILGYAATAPSAFNEQPWRYAAALRGDEHFEPFASLLVEGNEWAKAAGALIVTVASKTLARNGNVNHYARYDLGGSVAYLSLMAMSRGYYTHQMGGFDASRAQTLLRLPDSYEAVSMIAIGNLTQEEIDGAENRAATRKRRAISETVSFGRMGQD
jgi:nitroreductase